MSEESIIFSKLCSAYSNILCESMQNTKQTVCEDNVDESDVLHRHPAKIIPHGKTVRDGLYGDDSLDLKINQRGKASNLRDYEVSKASHYNNLIHCYDDNAEVLKKVADILDKENEDKLAHDLKNIIDELEELRDESDFQKDQLQSEVNRPYHVGDRYSSDYVDHEKPYYS